MDEEARFPRTRMLLLVELTADRRAKLGTELGEVGAKRRELFAEKREAQADFKLVRFDVRDD